VAASAVLSHAVARVHDRALLLVLDALHQLAAAVWVGGLAHFVLFTLGVNERGAQGAGTSMAPPSGAIPRRFSRVALVSVAALTAAGIGLTAGYVGDLAAFVGTAYGVMILSKVLLFVVALAFASANFGLARGGGGAGGRLGRYVEVELGLAVTVLFAAASLERLPIERAWSEYNHHWAGFFVVLMGLLALAERAGARFARHWPLVFLALAAFLFVRNDPKAWPLGPTGFWESLTLPDVLQHRFFVLLVVAFGVFEWAVRTGRLAPRPWGYVFPLLCAVGGGLLLTHSHAMFNLKQEFLTEVTHAPLGILGVFAGWGRWLELRLPESSRRAGWLWPLCFAAVGAVLLVYREG
jgi:putative copper resistance protein D